MLKMEKQTKKGMKALALISGGIDSPVAAFRMIEAGWDVDFLFFFTKPFVHDNERDIVLSCIRKLKEATGKKSFKLFICSPSEAHSKIFSKAPANLRYLLLRRIMWRTAEALAKKKKYSALITGESLGQVASQTLHNMVALSSVISIPIVRPLLGFDKEETTRIAEKIGTFEHSKCHRDCGLGPISQPRTSASEKELSSAERKLKLSSLPAKIASSVEELEA